MRLPTFLKPSLSSETALRGAVVSEFRRCPDVAAVTPCKSDPAQLVVTLGDGPVNCHLSNLSRAVLDAELSRRDQNGAIQEFVQSLVETQTLPAPSARDLVVGVRNRDYVAGMGTVPLHRDFTGDLVVVLMQDLPKSICLVTEDRLSDMTVAEAWAAAYDGISEMLLGDLDIYEQPEGGFWVGSETATSIGNSALLAVPLLHHLRREMLAETLLISAASRDGIELRDAADKTAESALEESIVTGLEGLYGQSACLFKLSEGEQLPRPSRIYDAAKGFRAYGAA